MARYATKAELRTLASRVPITEQASLRKSVAVESLRGSTFLSHSSKDEELVVGAIVVLQKHGGTVYVDEIDPEMPPYTTEETAAILKKRIQQANRFVLLTSRNSKDSRWVPWELGIADGYKEMNQIALFPASDTVDDDTWTAWEYLGLYRKIVFGKMQGYEEELWMVLDEKRNTGTPLNRWLAGG